MATAPGPVPLMPTNTTVRDWLIALRQFLTFSDTSGTFCEGDDSRLSDTREPTAHAASHAFGGTDAMGSLVAWTPRDVSAGGLTLTVAEAQVTTFGPWVLAACYVTYPANASGAGAEVGGLPVTSHAFAAQSIYGGSTRTDSTLAFDAKVVRNDTKVTFHTRGNVQITNAQLATYFVSLAVLYRRAA